MHRILVVEDDYGTRRLVSQILRHQGYEVAETENGLEAVEMLERDPDYNLIVTDLRMSYMDGLELLAEVRLRWQHIPVIILSVHSVPEWRQTALQQGAIDYLTKPFSQNELVSVIASAINGMHA
ncbi:MAG: response regulator [Anaerolineae bacterium]|nr:response regulator [Anaerolineae bacterium]